MRIHLSTPEVPQLPLDLFCEEAPVMTINSPRFAGQAVEVDPTVTNSSMPVDALLASMQVDDRALSLGITNWRALLDHAISSGYTEMYAAEDDQTGLRKPGHRFGPISRMPARGPDYVRERLARLKK